MNVFLRIASLAAASVALCGTALAQQTLTFSNTTPPVQVTLSPSSTLGISTNGNVTASCVTRAVPGGSNTICDGMPEGGGTTGLTPPTVTLAASGFSTTIDANLRYDPFTTFTLTPTVSGIGPASGEVCLRLLGAGSPAVANWSGAVVSPFGPQAVQVTQASSTYSFQLRCYSAGGAATSTNIVEVQTNAGGIEPPPPQCTAITPPSGYTQQLPPTLFTEVPLVTPSGFFLGNFPTGGGGQGRITPNLNRFVSIRFNAPNNVNVYNGLAKHFSWLEAQQGGLGADLSAIYVSVSQCPNDFRIPANNNPAPSGDPTFARGCRNYRAFTQTQNPIFLVTIDYDIGATASDFDTCMINPGGTYYFNMILASPVSNLAPGQNPCQNQASPSCGIQMSIE